MNCFTVVPLSGCGTATIVFLDERCFPSLLGFGSRPPLGMGACLWFRLFPFDQALLLSCSLGHISDTPGTIQRTQFHTNFSTHDVSCLDAQRSAPSSFCTWIFRSGSIQISQAVLTVERSSCPILQPCSLYKVAFVCRSRVNIRTAPFLINPCRAWCVTAAKYWANGYHLFGNSPCLTKWAINALSLTHKKYTAIL